MNVDEMMASARDAITVRRVFGEPIERDGVTVIPAARVKGGAGGGRGKDEKGEEGGGGGFGVEARPAGVYTIADGRVKWIPAVDPARMVTTIGLIALAILALKVKAMKTGAHAHGHHRLASAAKKAALMRLVLAARARARRSASKGA